jgi:hypothetical protein
VLPSARTPVIYKSFLPVLYRILDDTKPEMRHVANSLVKEVYEIIGPSLIEMAPGAKHKRILDIIK